MGANLTFNDNDDVQLKGGTDATLIGNVGDKLKVSSTVPDDLPSTQSITALDTVTASFVGANGQVFYTGTPTTNSAATFALASVCTAEIQATLIGAGGTMVVEVSADGGVFWVRPNAYQPGTQSYSNNFTAPFLASLNVSGFTHVRVRGTVSWTGTATIRVVASQNQRAVDVADSIPPGTNAIGAVLQSGTWTVQPGNTPNTVAWKVDGSAVTQPVSAVSLPLPTGAATAALQTAGNASLVAIDAALPAALGQLTAANSMSVVLASDQTNIPVTDVLATATGVEGALTVGTSAVAVRVGGANLAARKSVTLYNNGTVNVYWGLTTGVTTASGTPIEPGARMAWGAGPLATVYVISGTAAQNTRVTEGA